MYPASFEYHAATSVAEALALLAQYGDEAKLLAGGHSLIPVMKLRFASPAHLVDIARIPGLSSITDAGSAVHIGATARHADVVASAVVRGKAPLLSEVASHIGDPLIRNMGTIGGSLAHADPAADLPSALLALGATLVATGSGGTRTIAADDFFTDVFATALRANEILTEIRVPAQAAGSGGAYEKNPDPASGYAIVGIAVQLQVAEGKIAAIRTGMTGLGPKAMRLAGVEGALTGQPATAATLDAAAARAADGLVLVDDAKGSAAYKANLARVHARRALGRALAAAGA
ncbi:MAG TPA: xanthine dehydrogenase family protein subunit M [Gemmatimonadaceae bacterium]|nr:xanthine dehydrogenase family protein subunit M [Gemmatimonadaceae bacterium]